MMRANRYFCRVSPTRRHAFDPATHRCACGRYAHGHAPAKEYVKPRAECQICERKQACDKDGTLSHHGYKRPGWGFIQGDCMGEGHAPYPATDALEKYLVACTNYFKTCKSLKSKLDKRDEMKYTFKPIYRGEEVTLVYKRGDNEYTFKKEYPHHCLPSFDSLVESERKRLEWEIKNINREIKRVETRIANAKQE